MRISHGRTAKNALRFIDAGGSLTSWYLTAALGVRSSVGCNGFWQFENHGDTG